MRKQLIFAFIMVILGGFVYSQITEEELKVQKERLQQQNTALKKEIAEYVEQDEDVLTRAMFPKPSIDFFRYRNAQRYQIDHTLLNEEDKVYPV